jgi:hypothetical protein
MKWINLHLEKIALVAVIIAALWIILGPIILTQFSIIDFTNNVNNTGLIGDTIGGITAPVVGLISIILLYLALIKQIESNQIAVHEANFRIIYEEIAQIRINAESFSYKSKLGIQGIGTFAADIGATALTGQLVDAHYNKLDNFDILLNRFQKVFYLLDNLKTSEMYKDILAKDLQNVFSLYFNTGYNIMQGEWNVSEEDLQNNFIKGKMFAVKDHLRNILSEILRHNPTKK